MRIRLLLFALYRDLAGVGELDVDVAPGSTAAVAVSTLRQRDPRFTRIPERPVIAVNREYADSMCN
jgi:molybdopterin converting factor small subunit